MPLLDVSDVLYDPDFNEPLVIYRRVQNIDATGRVTIVETRVSPPPIGVVLAQQDSPLVRGPDQQNLPRLIEIHTPYRLRSASRNSANTEQYQPDMIEWNGDRYVVNKIQDYSRFGRGFIMADASSIDPVDVEPAE